jgi:glycosyltransferase involved in cell wall biosynthesis
MNKPRVLLVGSVCNLSGYSEHARTLLDSLMEMQDTIELYVQNTQWAASTTSSKYYQKYKDLINKTNVLFNSRKEPDGKVNIAGLFDITYQVRPPNEFHKMSDNDIGVTAALETTFAPTEWVSKCNLMKHILVVSEHAKRNLKNTKDQNGKGIFTPITVVPFGFNSSNEVLDIYEDIDVTTDFNFLTVCQMAPRKNFENMLSWFVQEFKNDENVGLFVKTHLQNNSTLDFHAVKARINHILDTTSRDRKCKVYLLHGNFTEQQMMSLYNPKYIDCYISATHGEGFGIPIFNAACNNIPIIATNWSGHLDFLRAPVQVRKRKKIISHFLKVDFDIDKVRQHHLMPGLITENCLWAYPKEESFRKNLRLVRKDKSSYLEDSDRLSSYLREKYSLENITKQYQEIVMSDIQNANWSSSVMKEVVSV